jgi:alpha-1,3-rhamnosyltransferase
MNGALSDPADAPLVTAILVCWNHARFAKDAVLSAVNQTYGNLEVIVFDNGSTDGSPQVLEDLNRSHKFKLICQDNVGLVKALNRGLSIARGKYIALLATDDIWLPEKTATQVAFMESNPDVHLLFGATRAIDANGNFMEGPARRGSFVGEVTFEKLMTVSLNTSGPTVMVRTETLRKIGGYDESFKVEDFPLVAKLTHDGHRVVGIPDVLTYYRRHDNNWSSTPLLDDKLKVGSRYRDSPYYVDFVNIYVRSYFRYLAEHKKTEAIRLLIHEPIRWNWQDVGVGLFKLCIPAFALRLIKDIAGRKKRKAPHVLEDIVSGQ